MTTPKYTSQISLGNILQALVLLLALSGGWFLMKADVGSNKGRIDDHEARLRVLEAASTVQGADFRAMKETLGDIRTQQVENNRLLRQLIQQGGGR